MNTFKSITLKAGTLLLLGILFAGCSTTDKAKSGSTASVLITGHTPEEIRQTTVEVFKTNGYERVSQRVSDLAFEKKGTVWETATYGGWYQPVWIEMHVFVSWRGSKTYVLACDPYLLLDRGEVGLQERRKLYVGRAGECKEILDQIKARLDKSKTAGKQPDTE